MIREGESAWLLVLCSTQGKHTPWWAVAPTYRRWSVWEGNVLLSFRRIPTLWAYLSYTLSMWLLQVRVSLKITPRFLWVFTSGIRMPAMDTDLEFCGATPFNLLPQIFVCSLFSALNSIPQISSQDEAAVTSWDRPTVVVVMFFLVVYAAVSSANMEQLFVVDFEDQK